MGPSAVRVLQGRRSGQRSGRGDPRVPDPVHSNHGEDAARLGAPLLRLPGGRHRVPGATPRSPPPGWLFGRVDTSSGWDPIPPASPPRRLRLFELQVSVEQGSAENGERFLRVRQLPHDQVDADRVSDLQRQDEAEHT